MPVAIHVTKKKPSEQGKPVKAKQLVASHVNLTHRSGHSQQTSSLSHNHKSFSSRRLSVPVRPSRPTRKGIVEQIKGINEPASLSTKRRNPMEIIQVSRAPQLVPGTINMLLQHSQFLLGEISKQ